MLRYRMPGDGWRDRAHVPLQDAARAMRLIRARAAGLSIDPKRVAILDFSAGGHIAAMLSVLPEQAHYPAGTRRIGCLLAPI